MPDPTWMPKPRWEVIFDMSLACAWKRISSQPRARRRLFNPVFLIKWKQSSLDAVLSRSSFSHLPIAGLMMPAYMELEWKFWSLYYLLPTDELVQTLAGMVPSPWRGWFCPECSLSVLSFYLFPFTALQPPSLHWPLDSPKVDDGLWQLTYKQCLDTDAWKVFSPESLIFKKIFILPALKERQASFREKKSKRTCVPKYVNPAVYCRSSRSILCWLAAGHCRLCLGPSLTPNQIESLDSCKQEGPWCPSLR